MTSRFLLPSGALCVAAALLLAADGEAFAFLGGSLDLTQRDFRIHNNFVNVEANNNTTLHPDYPGATGAVQALWKGVAEWGSELHGSGQGDFSNQDGIGSGGANFDASYQGLVSVPGGTNENIMSMLPGFGGGLIAFTELPIADGWRIRFYEQPSIWHDGPGSIPAGTWDKDLQGVAAHEYGHALGLDHTTVLGSTMQGGSGGNQIENRSLEADDIAGVQALYGSAAPNKPHVESYRLENGNVVVIGSGFAATGNEVWFTRGSGVGDGSPVSVTGLASSAGGTQLTATIPAEAGAGDLLVKLPTSTNASLSNAFPFDPLLGYCPPIVVHGVGKTTSNGSTPTLTAEGTPSVFYGNLGLSVIGATQHAPAILFYGSSPASMSFMGGTLYSNGPYVRDSFHTVGTFTELYLPITVDASMVGSTRVYQLWFMDGGDAFGVGLTNGLEVTFCL